MGLSTDAEVMSVPLMVTLAMPASAATSKVSVTVSPVASVTSLSASVMTGAASAEPVILMVSVVLE